MRPKVNYRKIYGPKNIPKGWQVHHIDWDAYNNELDNLIPIPKIIHSAIHSKNLAEMNDIILSPTSTVAILERSFIENLIKIYKRHLAKGKAEDEIKEIIEDLLEEHIPKLPTKKQDAKLKKLKKEFTDKEILKGRHHYPKGEAGDAIYSYIFGT